VKYAVSTLQPFGRSVYRQQGKVNKSGETGYLQLQKNEKGAPLFGTTPLCKKPCTCAQPVRVSVKSGSLLRFTGAPEAEESARAIGLNRY
jgi:hypothetical protein